MKTIKNTKTFMRVVHRYLGYFMAGIMAVYAISGVLLIYRNTDFLKKENHYEKTISKNLTEKEVGEEIKLKKLEFERNENSVYFFKNGTYNAVTGEVKYSKKELPFLLDKMTKLHKADTDKPFFLLNTFFGISLLFFVISSFWMFNVQSKIFRKGMIFAAVGFALALLLLYL